jgi:hypothetical protein
MDRESCERQSLQTLGLGGSGAGLFSPEGLAATIRRAASFLCPCPPRRIVEAVLDVLTPLQPPVDFSREQVSGVLDLLIAGGDLVELRTGEFRASRLVYLGPPIYVEKEVGRYLVAGIRPYGAPLLDADISDVACEGHTRTVDLDPSIAAEEMQTFGLTNVPQEMWVGCPSTEVVGSLLERIRVRLGAAAPAGGLTQLQILDKETRVTYYKGRWRDLRATDNGDFVARRPQEFGADLWCAVRVVDGIPCNVIDFPIDDPLIPGRDEAWRLQAAIDASGGRSQQLRLRPIDEPHLDRVVVDFFSPLPGWAERRLQLVGTPVSSQAGALFSFRMGSAAATDLIEFFHQMLWMVAKVEEGRQ